MASLRPCPSLRQWTLRLLPIVLSTSATMFYGNASYLTLSVAFIQVGFRGPQLAEVRCWPRCTWAQRQVGRDLPCAPQILKAFTPALTLLLCVAAGLERPTIPLLSSVMLIAGGTAR